MIDAEILRAIVNRAIFRLPDENRPILEQIQLLIDQCLPGHLGLRLIRLDADQSEARLSYRREIAGLHGYMHGGAIFTAGDTLTALMLLHQINPDTRNVLTTDAGIRYLRPLPDGDLIIKGRIIKRTGNKIKMVADFFNEAGKRIAQSRFTCLLYAGQQ